MSDLARKSLCDLIKQYGPSLGNDPKRCEGLLKDYCGEEKREILLIVNAAKEGIPEGLSGSQTNMPRELLIRNLIDRLQNNVGIEEKYAHWAVESWALALGVEFPEISLKSSQPSTPTPPEPPIAPPEPPSTPTPRRGLNWKLVVGLGAVITLITVSINFLTRRDTPVSVPTKESFALKLKGDYTQLNAYLKARDLENADRETFKVMLRVAGKKSESQGSFDTDEWNNFSCPDLIEIDRLWNSLSDKYGFKYQSRVYAYFHKESNNINNAFKTYDFLGWNNVNITNDVNFKYTDTSNRQIVLSDIISKYPISLPFALRWKDNKDYRFIRFFGGCRLEQ